MKKALAYLALLGLVTWGVLYGVKLIEQRGYDRRDAEVRIEQERLKAQTEQILRENEADARERDAELQARLADTQAAADARITTLTKHLANQAKNHRKAIEDATPTRYAQAAGEPDPASPVLIGAAVLDELTLRLLNDARANRPAQEAGDPAGRSDEEVRAAATASAVTGADLAVNDLMVVRQYHELAARHDTLVDWVKHQCVDPGLAGESP